MATHDWYRATLLAKTFEVPGAATVELDGAVLSYRDGGGSGPVAVLVHGWGADGLTNFAPVYKLLADTGWRPISVDLPGHGTSKDHRPVSLKRYAELVGLLCDQLGVARAVVVGYSMGGPVSQLLARSRPALVAGLVEVATAARVVTDGMRPSEVIWDGRLLGPAARVADGLLTRVRPSPGDGDHASMATHVWWMVTHSSYATVLAEARELAEYDAREWIGTLGVPCVCVVTEGDHMVNREAQEQLAQLCGASVLHAGGGHLLAAKATFGQVLVDALSLL
jgi:pimeloyl-ACP methyl ester carboxylesterase